MNVIGGRRPRVSKFAFSLAAQFQQNLDDAGVYEYQGGVYSSNTEYDVNFNLTGNGNEITYNGPVNNHGKFDAVLQLEASKICVITIANEITTPGQGPFIVDAGSFPIQIPNEQYELNQTGPLILSPDITIRGVWKSSVDDTNLTVYRFNNTGWMNT